MPAAELQRFSHILDHAAAGLPGPAPLKILADLYLRLHPLPPDLEARFAGAAIKLFGRADEASRLYASQRLSTAARLPERLLEYLIEAPSAVAAPILRDFRDLPPDIIALAASSFDGPRMRAIAGRPDVTGATIDLLLACGDRESVNALACNRHAFFDPPQVAQLCAHGDLQPAGARRLLDETPPGTPPEPGFFRPLDREGREAFLERLMACSLPQASGPAGEDDLGPSLAEGFVQLCRRGSEEAVAAIARLADMPRETVARGYRDPGGEILVVMIRACGLGRRALGAALVLNDHLAGVSAGRLRHLADLHDRLAQPAAQWLAAAWAGRPATTSSQEEAAEKPVPSRAAIHDPAVARPGAERRAGAGQMRRIQPAQDRQDRAGFPGKG